MKQKPNLVFKLAKTIISSCETESQLRDVIFFLKSSQSLDKVVRALEVFIDQEQFPKSEDVSRNKKAIKQEKISALVAKLRDENFSTIQVEFMIMKVFQKQISSNKVGLEKYVQKLSRNTIFEHIYNYFISENMHKSSLEDPWLKEMLNEQERRDNVHK